MAERQTHLDGLRGLAALVVVATHGIVAFDYGLYAGMERARRFSWDIQLSGAPFLLPLAGSLSVCLFFALSGYVLSHSFSTTRLGSIGLFAKRYVRLAIPILAACLLAYAVAALGWLRNAPLSAVTGSGWLASQLRQTPSFEQAFREGAFRALVHLRPYWTSYDSALWTMNIEFYGSLLLIAVFGLTSRVPSLGRRERWRIGIFALCAIAGASSYLGLFAFGALINLTQVERRIKPAAATGLLLAGLFLGTLPISASPWAVVRPFGGWRPPSVWFDPFPESPIVFWHAVGALLVLLAANSLRSFRRLLDSAFVQYLGHISFPLYLVHTPILISAVSFEALAWYRCGLPYAWTAGLSIVFLLAASLAAATGFFYALERPSIRLSGRVGRFADGLVRSLIGGSRFRGKTARPS
jgi:peptidoglycan/LPS O-acetylase OafA/YrhL